MYSVPMRKLKKIPEGTRNIQGHIANDLYDQMERIRIEGGYSQYSPQPRQKRRGAGCKMLSLGCVRLYLQYQGQPLLMSRSRGALADRVAYPAAMFRRTPNCCHSCHC